MHRKLQSLQAPQSLTWFRFWAQPNFSKTKASKVILFKEEIHLTWKTLSLQAKLKLLMVSLKIGYTHRCNPARLACDSSIQNCIFHGRWPEHFCLFFWINTQSWPGYLGATCKAGTTTGSEHVQQERKPSPHCHLLQH